MLNSFFFSFSLKNKDSFQITIPFYEEVLTVLEEFREPEAQPGLLNSQAKVGHAFGPQTLRGHENHKISRLYFSSWKMRFLWDFVTLEKNS